jgi:hypothetical protein
VLGANGAQQLLLVRAAHDIDERYAVLPADPHQHLAEVRRSGGVHQPDVAFRAHRLDEGERGQRIDEAGGAVAGRGPGRQRQAARDGQALVLRVHRAAETGDPPAEQCLRGCRRAGLHHEAGTLVADRQRLPDAGRHRAQCRGRYARDEHRALRRACDHRGGKVRRTDQHAQVRWIDRTRLDPDHDVIGTGFRHRYLGE